MSEDLHTNNLIPSGVPAPESVATQEGVDNPLALGDAVVAVGVVGLAGSMEAAVTGQTTAVGDFVEPQSAELEAPSVEKLAGFTPEPAEQPAKDPEIQPKLESLRERLHEPFNHEVMLRAMFNLATELSPHMAEFDLVIGDDIRGRLPAEVFGQMISMRRQEMGLEPAELVFINGGFEGEAPDGTFPAPTSEDARTLIVTDFINTGRNVKNLYATVGRHDREQGSVDIATLHTEPIARSEVRPVLTGATTVFSGLHRRERGVEGIDHVLTSETGRLYTGLAKPDTGLPAVLQPLYVEEQPVALPGQEGQPGYRRTDLVEQAQRDVVLIASELYALLPPVDRAQVRAARPQA